MTRTPAKKWASGPAASSKRIAAPRNARPAASSNYWREPSAQTARAPLARRQPPAPDALPPRRAEGKAAAEAGHFGRRDHHGWGREDPGYDRHRRVPRLARLARGRADARVQTERGGRPGDGAGCGEVR